jgi:tetratricopeptide (TPR) repeat protein
MVNLTGHEAGNGGYSQGTPTARCAFPLLGASDPKNVDALYFLSLTARELSQRESHRLFSLAPDSDLVHQLLGEAALTAENKSEAEEEFQKALKANPRSVEVLIELADLKRSQMKFDGAISYYTQAEQFDPLNYEIAYGLGVCYTNTQEYPRAIEWLQKAVALAPDSAAGRVALGKALIQNGRFAAAIPELKASLHIEPGMKQAYLLLGRAYSKLGRPEEAKAAFQKFDELNRAESQDAEAKPDGTTPPKQ